MVTLRRKLHSLMLGNQDINEKNLKAPTSKKNPKTRSCFICREKGHVASICPTKKDKASNDGASTSQSILAEKGTGSGNRKGLGHPDLKLKQVFQPKQNLPRSDSPQRSSSIGKSSSSNSHRYVTPTIFSRPQSPTRFQTPNRFNTPTRKCYTPSNSTPRKQSPPKTQTQTRSNTSVRLQTQNRNQTLIGFLTIKINLALVVSQEVLITQD